ncbi:MAG: ATP-binding protein [Campylobacterales bacterium]|nr:ATP-binding protein [Campylobacterales bacterium]
MRSCKLSNLPNFLNNILLATSNQKCNFAEPSCLVAVEALSSSHKHISHNNIFDGNVLSYVVTTQACHTAQKSYYPLKSFKACRSISDSIAVSLSNAISLTQHFKSASEAEDFKKYVRYATSEIINNVADHSSSGFGGCVAAQFYPRERKAQVAIADQGIGLMNALEKKYQPKTEEEAIFLSIEKGITGSNELMYGSGGYKNAGVGLFAIKKIVEETKGILSITSNDTTVLFDGKNKPKVIKLNNSFGGVLVAIEIYDDGLSEEFEVFKKMHIWSTEEDSEEIF